MTQEEKAKAYDNALEIAKGLYAKDAPDSLHLERMFPQLKESEDEKIRKSIHIYFDWLDGRKDYQPKGEYTIRDMIAWLEKQGEQKQDPCEHCADKRLNCHNFPCIKKRAFKQGKSVLEAIKEESQVYKTGDGEIITYSETDGYKLVGPKFKDGDVLKSPSHHLIWIYKDNEHYYACVNMNYVTKNVAIDGLIKIPSDACPATKEQRKQLEKAMTDAGYAFNFDKKELKKIVVPKFKIGDTMRTLQEASNGITSGLPVIVSIDNEYYHCNNELIAIKNQDNYEYPPMNRRQKPAWSEEDMSKIQRICKYLDEAKKYYADITEVRECIDWLKSLRPQYIWQPSDEQMETFENFVRGIWESCYDSPYENNTKLLYSLLEQLKKLK